MIALAAASTAAAALAALLALVAPGDPKVVPGHWNKRDIPAGWVVSDTEHYHVQCQAGKEKAERLSRHLEAMWAVYSDFMPTRRKPETFVLKIFENRKAFLEYSPTKTAVAYYDPNSKELVGYDTGIVLGARDTPAVLGVSDEVAARFDEAGRQRLAELFEAITDAYTMDTARALSHEGWHQYFHMYTVSVVAMPSWLDEGIGDYFFMADRDGGADEGHGYRLGAVNEHRVRSLHRALVDGTTVPFKRLLEFEQQDYYANPAVYYAQGWSMVQFLTHHEQEEYRELIPRLIRDFKGSKNFVKSTEKVFKGLDLDRLDREWIGWVTNLEVPDPLRDLALEFGDRLKPGELLTTDERLTKVYTWHLEHRGELFGDEPAAPDAPPAETDAPPRR